MAVESPGQPRDRSAAGNRPAASTTASVLTPLPGPRASVADSGWIPSHLFRWLASGGPLSPAGLPRWGEVSVTNLLGLPEPVGAVVAARARGTYSPPGLRGPRSDAPRAGGCGGRRLLKGVTPGLRGRQLPFISQLRLQRPLLLRPPPRTHFFLFFPLLPPSPLSLGVAVPLEAEGSGMSRPFLP